MFVCSLQQSRKLIVMRVVYSPPQRAYCIVNIVDLTSECLYVDRSKRQIC